MKGRQLRVCYDKIKRARACVVWSRMSWKTNSWFKAVFCAFVCCVWKASCKREQIFCFSTFQFHCWQTLKEWKLKRGCAEPTKTIVITGGLVSNGLFAQAAHLTTSPHNKNPLILSLAKLQVLLLILLITKTKSRWQATCSFFIFLFSMSESAIKKRFPLRKEK